MKTLCSVFAILLILAGFEVAAVQNAPPPTPGRQTAAPPAAPQAPRPPAAPSPPAPEAPRRPAAPVARSSTNIRVDVTVIEANGPQPLRKTVSVTSIDGLLASSRSVAGFGPAETNLHVDATPTLERNGKIQARIVVFYRPSPSNPTRGDGNSPTLASVNLNFPIVLDDGKTVVASQTTDPASDRRVTVEVTATFSNEASHLTLLRRLEEDGDQSKLHTA